MLNVVGHRPLGLRDAVVVADVLASDRCRCMVAARCEHGLNPRLLGGSLWTADHPSTSLCFSGANPFPLLGSRSGHELLRRSRDVTAACLFVDRGPADLVASLWGDLESNGAGPEVRRISRWMALDGNRRYRQIRRCG